MNALLNQIHGLGLVLVGPFYALTFKHAPDQISVKIFFVPGFFCGNGPVADKIRGKSLKPLEGLEILVKTHKMLFPRAETMSSTASLAVLLAWSRMGLSSTRSMEVSLPESARISMKRWASL